MIMILNNKEMTRQGYLVFHPLSSVKECQVRTNMLSLIIPTVIIIIIIRTLIIIIIIRTGVSKSCKLRISEFTDNSDYL